MHKKAPKCSLRAFAMWTCAGYHATSYYTRFGVFVKDEKLSTAEPSGTQWAGE